MAILALNFNFPDSTANKNLALAPTAPNEIHDSSDDWNN